MAVRIRVQLDADAGKLASTVQRAVAQGFQGAGRSGLATDPSGIINQIMGAPGSVAKLPPDWYLKQGARASMAMGQSGFSYPGMGGYAAVYRNMVSPSVPNFLSNPSFFLSNNIPPTIASVNAQRSANMGQFLKNFGFAGIPLLSPTSVLGNLFATRQVFSAFQGQTGQGILGGIGMGGLGGSALATGGVMAAALALGFSLKALERVVKEVTNAFESARKLYGKSVVSGTGLQFATFKQNLSQVLGVNENEIFKFGAELGKLSPKLQWANKTMTDSAREAGSVGQEIKLLEVNFKALFMEIAASVAPALRQIIAGFAGLAEALSVFFKEIKMWITLLSALNPLRGINVGAAAMVSSALIPGGSELINAFIKGMSKYDIGKLPAPEGMMKQLPVSAFERMGLVIKGFGPGNDYARRTAIATEKTAKLLNAAYSGGGVARSYQFFSPTANSP